MPNAEPIPNTVYASCRHCRMTIVLVKGMNGDDESTWIHFIRNRVACEIVPPLGWGRGRNNGD